MRVLVTGGAGSIGGEVVRALLLNGDDVRVLDINEELLWKIEQTDEPRPEVKLGDVQYAQDCATAIEGCDAVVHCAALKHVHLCEQSPRAALRVNVNGTRNVIKAAGERRVVVVSTDKAIRPESVMGRTKAAAMQLAGPNINAVVMGNVIGSRGSLVPRVIDCAKARRAIPITDDRMTRWMMTSGESVELILEALHAPAAGRIMGPKHLRSVNVRQFIEVCRDWLAPQCDIKRVGARPGERLHEWMITREGVEVRSDDPRWLMTDARVIADLLDRSAVGVAA